MLFWNFYFLEKLHLHFRDLIRIDLDLNLVLILFILFPLPRKLKEKRAEIVRYIVAVPAAIWIVWNESWFPDPIEAVTLLRSEGLPSSEYMLAFLLRPFTPYEVFSIVLILMISAFIRRVNHSHMAVMGLIFFSGFYSPFKVITSGDPEKYIQSFYKAQSGKTVKFGAARDTMEQGGFDIIVLHICSLAWGDLVELKKESDAFFDRFDFVFTRFNTATSYSGPAEIRLLRSNCGQQEHQRLYYRAPKECFLNENLTDLGYREYYALNHTGEYGSFAQHAREHGKMQASILSQAGLEAELHMFDNTPIYNNLQVLKRWSDVRGRSGEELAFMYYNTATLHDGNYAGSRGGQTEAEDKALYKQLALKLISDVTAFLKHLESTNRNSVVFLVSEHGRALHGSKFQIGACQRV